MAYLGFWVGNKGASKADSGPAIAGIQFFPDPSKNILWLWRQDLWTLEILNYRSVNHAQVTSAQFGQTVLLKLKIS